MKKIKTILLRTVKNFILFLLCGSIYYVAEILFKGSDRGSHWTMFVLAGLSGVIVIDGLNNIFSYEMDFLLQIILCAIFITFGEYIVGIIWNSDFSIWDYRHIPLNYKGQICLPFSLLWCVLSSIFIPFLDLIEWKIFKYKPKTPPYYKVFGKTIFKFKEV